jgi:uncharacterized protein
MRPKRAASLDRVPALTDRLDLESLRLSAGEGRRLELTVEIEPLLLGGERYVAQPHRPVVTVDVSRMVGHGYALRLRFEAALAGPCMRCLAGAAPRVEVDAREVDRPTEAGGHAPSALADLGMRAERVSPQSVPVSASGEELSSPYVHHETLDLAAWARDAFALSAPVQVLCRAECAGLCPICAVDLNDAGPEHHHKRPPDPRWAKLRELELE